MFDKETKRVKVSCYVANDFDKNAFVCDIYKDDEYVGSYRFYVDEDKIEFEVENPREIKELLKEIGLSEDDLKRMAQG